MRRRPVQAGRCGFPASCREPDATTTPTGTAACTYPRARSRRSPRHWRRSVEPVRLCRQCCSARARRSCWRSWLEDGSDLIDLDEPRVLTRTRLRPSQVATYTRALTQAYATRIYDEHPTAVGLSWWSTIEASLVNSTLYDRAADVLRLVNIQQLTLEHPATHAAADLLGLALAGS